MRGLGGTGELVVGAHFDTWFAGSTDNGGGVAAMLALAERRARRPPGALRHHASSPGTARSWRSTAAITCCAATRSTARARLCVIDFETPSAIGAQAYGLARSNHAPVEDAIVDVGLHELFALNVPMDLVAELFGGVIPTDIQGLYRSGAPAVATAVDAPYYHTAGDTPDKVDLARLEETVVAFDRAIDCLMTAPAERFAVRDPALWRLDVDVDVEAAADRRDDASSSASSCATPAASRNAPPPSKWCSSRTTSSPSPPSTPSATATDARTLRLPAAAGRDGRRFLHVSAGARWPLAEVVRPL